MRTVLLFSIFLASCGDDQISLPLCTIPLTIPCDKGCHDGKKGAYDADVDCGGTNPIDGTSWCAPCAAGKTCLTARDCQSRMCVNQVCQTSTCVDGIQNGNETDVDCGGGAAGPDAGNTCRPCAVENKCFVALDCESQICSNGSCSPSLCNDGKKDASETDVDCGGPVCSPCTTGKTCIKGSDCANRTCANNVCRP